MATVAQYNGSRVVILASAPPRVCTCARATKGVFLRRLRPTFPSAPSERVCRRYILTVFSHLYTHAACSYTHLRARTHTHTPLQNVAVAWEVRAPRASPPQLVFCVSLHTLNGPCERGRLCRHFAFASYVPFTGCACVGLRRYAVVTRTRRRQFRFRPRRRNWFGANRPPIAVDAFPALGDPSSLCERVTKTVWRPERFAELRPSFLLRATKRPC